MITLLILLVIFLWMYHFSEGATEGYTWANANRRATNKVIKGGATGAGFMDYHAYRMFENIGIAGAVIVAFYISWSVPFWKVGVGAYLSGFFIYERCLMYVVHDKWFKEPGWKFYILGLEIPRYPWQDWTLFFTGIALIIWAVL